MSSVTRHSYLQADIIYHYLSLIFVDIKMQLQYRYGYSPIQMLTLNLLKSHFL